jgi:hypothetical protein
MMPPAKRKSAFFSATQEVQKHVESENTVKLSDSDKVSESQSENVLPLHSETVQSPQPQIEPQKPQKPGKVKKDTKVSFYLTAEQEQKLDDLAYEHKKRTGKRINRNDIVRHLIDHCIIEDLYDIE